MQEPTHRALEYVPNEKIRARLEGFSAQGIRFIEINFRSSKSDWSGSLKITDRSATEEIFNAFRNSSRLSGTREDTQPLKMDYDRFAFHFRRWWARDRIVLYRVYSPIRWGPSIAEIYKKYRRADS